MTKPKLSMNGWFKPWMAFVFTIALLVAGGLVTWGSTSKQVEFNDARIDRLEAQMEQVSRDVAFIRGRLEAWGPAPATPTQ